RTRAAAPRGVRGAPPATARRSPDPSAGSEDPLGFDQHRDPALVPHDAVVLVPVLVRPARGGEDPPEEPAQAVVVDAVERIVGTGELHRALDSGPLPTRPDDHGGPGPSAQ